MAELRALVVDSNASIASRNRAAFWLRERKDDPAAREALRAALRLKGDSCLLRHEVAYILGQIGESDSVQDLCSVLEDATDDEIVRHEAAEALGAIGDETARPFLEKFSSDRARVVRETCRLALDLLEWRGANEAVPTNSYRSVDPAPPAESTGDLEDLKRSLLDADRTMWDRYRAMFTLRDLGTRPAVLALAEAVTLSSDRLQSDLLRHEIAFVLGQLADEAAVSSSKSKQSLVTDIYRLQLSKSFFTILPCTQWFDTKRQKHSVPCLQTPPRTSCLTFPRTTIASSQRAA